MQNVTSKFPVKILLFLLFLGFRTFSQPINAKLAQGDSLFKQKQYTQSYKIYEELYEKDKVYSSEMLLKMAFIQEGLDNYTKALYYLNLFYSNTHDNKASEKIETLAEKHRLQGYEYSDANFIYNLYKFYYQQIVFVFTFLIGVLVIFIAYATKRKMNMRIPAIFLLIVMVITCGLHLFISKHTSAIISETTYLMKGPSAGADVEEVLKKGNKVKVLDEEDVWLKVLINDKEGYIRRNNVLLLES